MNRTAQWTSRFMAAATLISAFGHSLPPAGAADSGSPPPAVTADSAVPCKGSVLFVYSLFDDQVFKTYFDYLRERGLHARMVKPWELTDDLCRQFNVIVHLGWPKVLKEGTDRYDRMTEASYQRACSLYREHIEKGGGMVFCNASKDTNEPTGGVFLDGMRMLPEAVVDAHAKGALTRFVSDEFCWTDNIAPSPVTKDVKRIWYPMGGSGEYAPLHTFNPGTGWTVIVRGKETAASYAYTQGGIDRTKPATYPSAPPLAAIREQGKSRQAMFIIFPKYTFGGFRNPVFENVPMEKGTDGTSSDLALLFENIFLWAAEPSLRDKTLGGYMRPAYVAPKPVEVKPLVWDDRDEYKGTETLTNHTGVMGLHTAYSDGKGTVAEYVAEAVKLGYDFLIFTESFEHMTESKWKSLVSDCEQNSGDAFLCVPGLEYRDTVGEEGNRYYLAGNDKVWPRKERIAADGRRVKDQTRLWFDAGSSLQGFYSWKTNPWKPWDMFGLNSAAVVFYENGDLREDNTKDFLYLQRNEDDLVPAVMDRIFAPQDLVKTAGHLKMKMTGSMGEVKTFLLFPGYGQWNDHGYISSGPELVNWSKSANAVRDTDGLVYVPGHDRWRLHLAVRSTVPLKEVALYNGPALYRRFAASGNSFQKTLDLLHDRQRHMTVVALDEKGGKLISWMRWTRDLLNARKMCSDRCNSIPISKLRDSKGISRIVGPTGIYHVKGLVDSVCVIGGALEIPLTDGGIVAVGYNPHPALQCLEGSEGIDKELWCRMFNRLASRDVFIQESLVDRKTVAADKLKNIRMYPAFEPSRFLEGYMRFIDFNRRFDDPCALLLIEGEMTLKQETTLSEQLVSPHLRLLSFSINETRLAAFQSWRDENLFFAEAPKGKDILRKSGFLGKGGYISCFPSRCGSSAMFALNDGLFGYLQESPTETQAQIGYALQGRKLPKGTKLPYRLLILTGQAGETSNERQEKFRQAFGLSGNAPAYQVTARCGAVADTQFLLTLKTKDYGFAGIVSQAALPVRLPIRAQGLSEKWTAVVYNFDTRLLLPVGIAEETDEGYTQLDIANGPQNIFIGHPIVCDNPDILITVVPVSETALKAEFHNPTQADVRAKFRAGEGFTAVCQFSEGIDIPAGSSVSRMIPMIVKNVGGLPPK